MPGPGLAGSGRGRSAERFYPSGRTRWSSGLTKTRLSACASCRSPSPRCSRSACTFDLTSSAADRDQEIDRLRVLGARRVDIGQAGAESWTVLADPEGNEF